MSRTTNETSTVRVSREVILAAGAVRTPQILQLSGVGPEPLLSSLGIKTLFDLPGVGSNFQDQPTLYMQFSCKLCVQVYERKVLMIRKMATIPSRRRTGFSRMRAGPQTNLKSTTRITQVVVAFYFPCIGANRLPQVR
jgi:choline dehydrogenase-like flavoprotein